MSIKNDRKISLQKFSNINLFERREKNYSAIKKSNHPLKLYHYMKNKKENKNSEFNQIVYSFYSFQTERKKTSKPSSKKIKYNITATSIFNKTNDNFSDTTFPFYLTQTETNKLKINNIKLKNFRSRNNKVISLNKITPNYNDLIFSRNYQTFTNFNKFKNNKGNKESNKEDEIMNLKLKKLRPLYNEDLYNNRIYIDKTRELLLIKYTSSTKNERNVRCEEIRNNRMEIIDDRIKSLQKVKSLYNQRFNDKILEYVKFIFKKKEFEQNVDSELLKKIFSLKKEISQLMGKIRKIEIEKFNIINWLFFLIKLKEKKLRLPHYYEKILEANLKRNYNQRRTAKADIRNINPSSKKGKSNTMINGKIVFNNNKGQNLENNFNEIPKEEVSRILKYRKELIFETPEDFMDEIKDIENHNIKLFSVNDTLHYDIKDLKEELNILKKEQLKSNISDKIKEKQLELNEIKTLYNKRLKMINKYNDEKNKKSKNKSKIRQSSFNINLNDIFRDDKDMSLTDKKRKLYSKVEQLYITCQQLRMKKNSFSHHYIMLQKGYDTKEEEILKKLEYIEVRICHLLNIFSIYKNPHNPNYELIRKLRNHFTRKRKIEKAELVRKEKEINYLKMIKKINNRNNRFIYLQRRKISMHNYAGWTYEKSKNKSSNKNKIYLPTFDDFMFDYNRSEKINLTSDNDFGSFK